MDNSLFRKLPKMDKLLARPKVAEAGAALPRALLRETAQGLLDELRSALASGAALPGEEELEGELLRRIGAAGRYRLRRVVNATGIVLHTNLGRAPLGETVAAHVAEVARGYSNLEYDLEKGGRGSRTALVEELLCRVTGAEAALAVNNNAAAVFLLLHTLACGRRVLLSRGELVEIGGSFRVPEIMAASGAELVEIGTTNKTRLSDYEVHLASGDAQAVLKVHSSNFRIVGFTESVSLEELRGLADRYKVPLFYDMGAGFLHRPAGFEEENAIEVRRAVKAADVVCFSGDKLLGGAQAGILLGKRELIEKLKHDPLARVLRVDKMTLAALEAVLRLYTDERAAQRQIPVLRMLSLTAEELRRGAESLAAALRAACPGWGFDPVPCEDEPGGGSLAELRLPGWAVAVSGPLSPDEMELRLRSGEPPVVARIHKGRLLLSLRTLCPGEEAELAAAFAAMGAEK